MFTLPTPVLEVARGLGFWLQAWVGGAKKHMGDRRAPNPLWAKGRWTPTGPEALALARKAPWKCVLLSFPCTAKALNSAAVFSRARNPDNNNNNNTNNNNNNNNKNTRTTTTTTNKQTKQRNKQMGSPNSRSFVLTSTSSVGTLID